MAEENGIDPNTRKMLADMAMTVRQLGEHAKQMADAINSSTKPMRELNDLTKAIREQTGKINEAMKETADKSVQASTQASSHKEAAVAMYEATLKQLAGRKDLSDVEEKMLGNADILLETTTKISVMQHDWAVKAKEREQANKAELGYISLMVDKLKERNLEWSRKNPGAAHTAGLGSEILTGQSSLAGGMGAITSGISKLMPALSAAGGIGGLLGLMITGRAAELEYNAIGQQAAQMFDQVGGHTDKFAARLGSMSRSLEKHSMAGKEDLMAVAKGFAAAGVSAAEAQTKVEGIASTFGGDLLDASLRLDKAFEMQAGTAASLAGVLSGQFNMSAKEAFVSISNIATASEKAGGNAVVFMQQVMEASGSLRLLNAHFGQTADIQAQMFGGMQGKGFNAQFSQQYAAAGGQQATQGISSMNVGLSAIIGEEMGFGSGLDAWYKMTSAQARGPEEKLEIADIALKIAEKAQDVSGKKSEQVYFLEQMGFGKQGAEAILGFKERKDSGQELTKESMDFLNNSLKGEAQKTSELVTAVNLIKDGILHIGNGLLGMIVNILKMLFQSSMAIFSALTGGGDFTRAREWEEMATRSMTGVTHSGELVRKGVKQVGEGGAGLLSGMGLTGSIFPDDAAKRIANAPETKEEKAARQARNDAAVNLAYRAVTNPVTTILGIGAYILEDDEKITTVIPKKDKTKTRDDAGY